MWGCFLMSGVKILHFLKDWWKSIPIHQNYTMALRKWDFIWIYYMSFLLTSLFPPFFFGSILGGISYHQVHICTRGGGGLWGSNTPIKFGSRAFFWGVGWLACLSERSVMYEDTLRHVWEIDSTWVPTWDFFFLGLVRHHSQLPIVKHLPWINPAYATDYDHHRTPPPPWLCACAWRRDRYPLDGDMSL